MDLILFYVLSIFSIISLILMINQKKIIYSVIYLAFFFTSIASIFALLGAIYLAIFHFLIFVGGIVVIILMTIMVSYNEKEEIILKNKNLLKFLSVATFIFILTILFSNLKIENQIFIPTINQLSKILFEEYSLVTISAITILLISLIASLEYLKRNDRK